ncbi:hypothetical protein D3C84_1036280 [compost metagenome]
MRHLSDGDAIQQSSKLFVSRKNRPGHVRYIEDHAVFSLFKGNRTFELLGVLADISRTLMLEVNGRRDHLLAGNPAAEADQAGKHGVDGLENGRCTTSFEADTHSQMLRSFRNRHSG